MWTILYCCYLGSEVVTWLSPEHEHTYTHTFMYIICEEFIEHYIYRAFCLEQRMGVHCFYTPLASKSLSNHTASNPDSENESSVPENTRIVLYFILHVQALVGDLLLNTSLFLYMFYPTVFKQSWSCNFKFTNNHWTEEFLLWGFSETHVTKTIFLSSCLKRDNKESGVYSCFGISENRN